MGHNIQEEIKQDEFFINKNYSKALSKEILENDKKILKIFKTNDAIIDCSFNKINSYGMLETLSKYVDKYLSLSENKECYYLNCGTTCSVYKIGDYVIKLINFKWSYEDEICPDLYIILPNLEEVYYRNSKGIINAGIEVQKYLKRSACDLDEDYFDMFLDELNDLGYWINDHLVRSENDDNCRLLDNYLDSGNTNPPEWFKENPLVLIDRDRIYKLTNKKPKQIG